jgi:hypothetical protein
LDCHIEAEEVKVRVNCDPSCRLLQRLDLMSVSVDMLSVRSLTLDGPSDLGKPDNLRSKSNENGIYSNADHLKGKETDNGYHSSLNPEGSFDFSKLLDAPRPPIQLIDTRRSLDEKSFHEILGFEIKSQRPSSLQTVVSQSDLEGMDPSTRSVAGTPRGGSSLNTPRFPIHPMTRDAWEALNRSLVYYKGNPVGTIAALDPNEESLNYNQV